MDLAIKVNDAWRAIPEEWWDAMEGPKPNVENFIVQFSCNGCSFSPDYPFRTILWPACAIHDYHYSAWRPLGKYWSGRRAADNIFRTNILTILKLQDVGWIKRNLIALLYWQGVRRLGSRAYPYDEFESLSMLQKVQEQSGVFRGKWEDA